MRGGLGTLVGYRLGKSWIKRLCSFRACLLLLACLTIGGMSSYLYVINSDYLLALANGDLLPTPRVALEPPTQRFVDAVKETADKNNVVVVLAASFGYHPMLLNTECSMRRVGVKRALLIALDQDVYAWARKRDFFYPVLLADPDSNTSATPGLIRYGTRGFSKVTFRKFASVEKVLATGASVLFTDGDVFWCQNPIPEILAQAKQEAHRRTDILFQTSWAEPNDGDFINSGFYFARPTRGARQLFLRILLDVERYVVGHDQRAVNNRLCNALKGGRVIYERRPRPNTPHARPVYCTQGRTRVGFLDHDRFPNGRVQIAQLLSKTKRSDVRKLCDKGKVAVLHNNWIEGEEKILRFQAKGLWYASPDNTSCLSSPAHPSAARLRLCGYRCTEWLKDLDDP